MNHNSPKNSVQHNKLIKLAIHNGLEGFLVKRLLWIINSHDSLISFPRICQNISNILVLMNPLDKTSPAIQTLNNLAPVLEWVHQDRLNLTQAIGPDFDRQPSGPKDHPVMGQGSKRHPLYTTLWNTHEDKSVGDEYRTLQGHLLIAHVGELLRKNNQADYENFSGQTEWKGFDNSPYPASLAVRLLSEASYAPVVQQLKVAVSPKKFAQSLNILPTVHSRDLLDTLNNLRRFLQKHHGIEEWVLRNRPTAGNSTSGGSPRVTGYVEISPQLIKRDISFADSSDPFENFGATAIINEIDLDHPEQQERLDADLAPDEVDQHELLLIDFNTDQTGTVSANSGAQQRHIAMANQLFPWAYQQLTLSELSGFLAKAVERFTQVVSTKKGKIFSDSEQEIVEIVCLIRVMIFTGSDFERARKTVICLNGQPNQNVDVVYLFDQGKPGRWQLRAMKPDYKTQNVMANSLLDRPRTDFFEFPDITFTDLMLAYLVSHTLDKINPLDAKPTQFQLVRESKNFRQNFLNFLKQIDPSGRVTEHKLSMFLFHRLLEVSHGDVCATSIICGYPHPLARVRMFYSVNSVNELEKLYREAIGDLASQLLKVTQRTNKITPPPVVQNHFSVGSRFCPTYDAVKNSVSQLRRSLTENRNRQIENGFHNQYVLWVLWHFNFSTACRAIVDPYIPVGELDPVTGVGLLADKDDGTGYKARLICIPPFVRTLMASFESYLELVINEYHSVRYSSHLPFFLRLGFRGKISAEPVQPRTVGPVMEPFLPYPTNFHRRFMRTTLLDRGCPGEVVDAWMGHWHAGEEPWGPYSTFSFREYRNQLETFLVPIMQDLGLDGSLP
ncbi:hypothetical protein [Ferrovum sp.]|uniref:hypothetical protein n=1 Tax=Ferrovum sp. TaxID=2609467 RepID=UPI0026097805|nr:hypothetical protein [Ferrovum sp.]